MFDWLKWSVWRRGPAAGPPTPRFRVVNINVYELAVAAGFTEEVAQSRELLRFAGALSDEVMRAAGAQATPLDDVPKALRDELQAARRRLMEPDDNG